MRGLARKFFFCVLLLALVWLGGLFWFMQKIPRTFLDTQNADAIVVLTGASGRVEQGLRLFAEGRAAKIFISGAGKNTTLQDILKKTSAELRDAAEAQSQNIILGHEAENTIGNAEETAAWFEGQGGKSILLVTSSYHMPRALEELKRTMPNISLIPAPVFSDDFSLDGWWKDESSRMLLMSEYHKFIASKLRHAFVSATASL